MTYLFIILIATAIASATIYYIRLMKAHEIEEKKPKINFDNLDKFQPRKVTYVSKKDVINSINTPKKKYYKKKKKKPTVVNNTIVDKRPVGRPKKEN